MSWLSHILQIKKKFESKIETLNTIHISKNNLLNNYDYLCSLQVNWEVFPVLKSNAYGHGITQIATILRERKISYIAVDSYYEALQVHEVNSSKILLMGYMLPSNFSRMDFSWITPVVSDFDSLEALWQLKKYITIHIKIDTGMNRLGFRPESILDILQVLKKYPKLRLEGACSHFAESDEYESAFSEKQLTAFSDACEYLQKFWYQLKYRHINNSAATIRKFSTWNNNAMRAWIALYWINPIPHATKDFIVNDWLQPVLSFQSTIVHKKQIKQWETVSYGRSFVAPWDMEIGIVPVGYHEWLDRRFSSSFSFFMWAVRIPVIGRICMNMCVVDLTNKSVKVGDSIEIVSDNKWAENSIETMADRLDTIPYEILVWFAESIRREII